MCVKLYPLISLTRFYLRCLRSITFYVSRLPRKIITIIDYHCSLLFFRHQSIFHIFIESLIRNLWTHTWISIKDILTRNKRECVCVFVCELMQKQPLCTYQTNKHTSLYQNWDKITKLCIAKSKEEMKKRDTKFVLASQVEKSFPPYVDCDDFCLSMIRFWEIKGENNRFQSILQL